MTDYSMTPINNGTRMRTDHNVFASNILSYNKGQVVVFDEIWEAPADGSEVKKGDKWGKVVSVDGVSVAERGWMAYIHKGVAICNNFKILVTPPPVDPPVVESAFPESFTLKGSDPKHISSYGKEAEYVFVRILP